MLGHVSFGVADLARSTAFYDGILAIDRVVDNKTICTREEFEKRYRDASPYAVAPATIRK